MSALAALDSAGSGHGPFQNWRLCVVDYSPPETIPKRFVSQSDLTLWVICHVSIQRRSRSHLCRPQDIMQGPILDLDWHPEHAGALARPGHSQLDRELLRLLIREGPA